MQKGKTPMSTDNPMTGDGAVVRIDHADAKAQVKWVMDLDDPAFRVSLENDRLRNLCRAYLAQAAQIERLTEELRSIDLAFGNRTALDDCKTRADKINKMCDAAGKYFTGGIRQAPRNMPALSRPVHIARMPMWSSRNDGGGEGGDCMRQLLFFGALCLTALAVIGAALWSVLP